MVVFDEILGELLMQNDCVVVPSLGGFVANTLSAKVDVDKGVITPPKKALSFNRNLTNNDGLLVNALAQKHRVSYNEANDSVLKDVSKVKAKLDRGERVHFQNVGFLYLNNAGKMAFEQDRFFNLLLESYGMGSIQFIPVEEEVEAEVPQEEKSIPELSVVHRSESEQKSPTLESRQAEVSNDNELHIDQPPRKKTSTLRKVARYAAVAALIPIAFYSFWIPMKTDVLQSGVVYLDDFNPFSESSNAKYVEGIAKERIAPDEVRIDDELAKITSNLTPNKGDIFSFPINEDEYVSVRYNKPESKSSLSKTIESKGYHLIVGCFSEKSNATSMIKKLNYLGWSGSIIDRHKGLHRVSAATSSNKKEILEKLNLIRQEGFSSWVLKK
jgi:hypothetical protein